MDKERPDPTAPERGRRNKAPSERSEGGGAFSIRAGVNDEARREDRPNFAVARGAMARATANASYCEGIAGPLDPARPPNGDYRNTCIHSRTTS